MSSRAEMGSHLTAAFFQGETGQVSTPKQDGRSADGHARLTLVSGFRSDELAPSRPRPPQAAQNQAPAASEPFSGSVPTNNVVSFLRKEIPAQPESPPPARLGADASGGDVQQQRDRHPRGTHSAGARTAAAAGVLAFVLGSTAACGKDIHLPAVPAPVRSAAHQLGRDLGPAVKKAEEGAKRDAGRLKDGGQRVLQDTGPEVKNQLKHSEDKGKQAGRDLLHPTPRPTHP